MKTSIQLAGLDEVLVIQPENEQETKLLHLLADHLVRGGKVTFRGHEYMRPEFGFVFETVHNY